MSGRICLITGATGSLGPTVVQTFLEHGYRIRALARKSPPAGLFDRSVEFIQGDACDDALLSKIVNDVHVIVHLAGLAHILDPGPSLRPEYQRINVGATENLVRSCRNANVERLVLFSTIAVYGPARDRIVSESTEAAPSTFYGRTKLEAERVVLAARNVKGKSIGTVLRISAVYGPRLKGNYERLVRAISRRRFVPLGRGDNRRPLIYDKDVARAALLAAERPEAIGEVFNVSHSNSPTVNEIIGAICDALGRPHPRFSIPIRPVRLGVTAAYKTAALVGVKLPVSPAAIDKFVEDMDVDSSKIRNRLGFIAEYDPQRGWREAIEHMKKAGP